MSATTIYLDNDLVEGWVAYIQIVETIAGRKITDGQTIDMLYTAYLGDVEAGVAAGRLDAMERASWAVQQVRRGIQETRMREEGNPLEILPRPRRRAWWRSGRSVLQPWLVPVWIAVAMLALVGIVLAIQHGAHP